MAENQARTEPQFILWVKEAGVFRPAEVKFPETHDWYDITYGLMRNCQLGTEDISPDALNLVSSVYLGPIRILEEIGDGVITQKDVFQRKREFKHETVRGIVNIAKEVARNEGVQYFSVVYFRSPIERTWKFPEEGVRLEGKTKEEYIKAKETYIKSFKPGQPSKPLKFMPLEFMLHPTAQLYVPRK